MVDYEDLILQRQEIRDELLEYCDGECDQCPYGKRIPASRGWSKAEFFKEDSWLCTLKEDD